MLPLPYALTSSTVCLHGERRPNGCWPFLITAPCGVSRWAEFELVSLTNLWEQIRPLCQRGFGPVRKLPSWVSPVRKLPSWVSFGLDRSFFNPFSQGWRGQFGWRSLSPSFESLACINSIYFSLCGTPSDRAKTALMLSTSFKYSQSHLGWHFRVLFQSSKLKARTSLLPRFSEKKC